MNKKYGSISIDEEKYKNLRRHLHTYPELAFEEIQTKKFLLDLILTFPNFYKTKVTEAYKSGFWIDINGENPNPMKKSKTICFRSDLDGLPLQEDTGLSYSSVNPGVMHACGHDGHMTILTCFLEYILTHLEKIPYNLTIRFLYQPAEEIGKGAVKMIEYGCIKDVEEIYFQHNHPKCDFGSVAIIPGNCKAGVNSFTIKVTGKGGHSSTPHLCRNPISCSARIISELNSLNSRLIDTKDRSVLAVGGFSAGTRVNIIPDESTVVGSYRALNPDVSKEIGENILKISHNVSKIYDCEVEIEDYCGALVSHNDEKLTDLVKQAILKSGLNISTEDLPSMGSEDFSFYQAKIPGVYCRIGCRDENHQDLTHTNKYDYNDLSTPLAVEVYVRIVELSAGIKIL